MKSIFTVKTTKPATPDLKNALGDNYDLWQTLVNFTCKSYPGAVEDWNFPSAKAGWDFRIGANQRVLITLLPRDQFFKVAFVFGQKAVDEILKSDINENIRMELKKAKPTTEGRGIKIELRDKALLSDIKKLIVIKIAKN